MTLTTFLKQHANLSCVSWSDVKVRPRQDFTTCRFERKVGVFSSAPKFVGGLDTKLGGSFVPQKLYLMRYQSTRRNDDHRSQHGAEVVYTAASEPEGHGLSFQVISLNLQIRAVSLEQHCTLCVACLDISWALWALHHTEQLEEALKDLFQHKNTNYSMITSEPAAVAPEDLWSASPPCIDKFWLYHRLFWNNPLQYEGL